MFTEIASVSFAWLRSDFRHNFSPQFLNFYILRAIESEPDSKPVDYNLALVYFKVAHWYQIILIIFGSTYPFFHRKFSYALFVQTITFVSFNEVITSQYFMWWVICMWCQNIEQLVDRITLSWIRFGCLLPLCFFHLNISGLIGDSCLDHKEGKFISSNWVSMETLIVNSVSWVSLLCVWLRYAFILEFNGENDFKLLWMISIIFHVTQVHVIVSCTRLFMIRNSFVGNCNWK